MNAIFDNALDSLKVGMSLCMSVDQDRMRKHAILTKMRDKPRTFSAGKDSAGRR